MTAAVHLCPPDAAAGERLPPPQESGSRAPARGPSQRNFLRLWLAQPVTQVGGNMVIYGLTVIFSATGSNSAVSLLLLTFLVPAVLLSPRSPASSSTAPTGA